MYSQYLWLKDSWYWNRVSSAFFAPLKHLHRLPFNPTCARRSVRGDERTYQITVAGPGITNRGQDYKALTVLYYTGVCLVWVRGASTAEALEFWIQAAQPCPPLLSCTASSILSRLPIISFSPPQCFTMSLFLYCWYPSCHLIGTFSIAPVGVRQSKIFFLFVFLREMFWG